MSYRCEESSAPKFEGGVVARELATPVYSKVGLDAMSLLRVHGQPTRKKKNLPGHSQAAMMHKICIWLQAARRIGPARIHFQKRAKRAKQVASESGRICAKKGRVEN